MKLVNAQLDMAVLKLIECFKSGGKLMVCGNGGSSSDSAHIVGELVKGFLKKRPLPPEWNALLGKNNLQMGLPALDLTAQGAVRLLLENTREYLVSKRVLVAGFGRIGRALAKMLSSLGLDVYVAARRSQTLAEASALGYKALDTAEIESTVYIFDFVFNTVPERIFSSECVSLMKSGAVYFELASSPYGAERGDFEKSKARFVSGSALPGRFCPRSCAEAVFGRISKYI